MRSPTLDLRGAAPDGRPGWLAAADPGQVLLSADQVRAVIYALAFEHDAPAAGRMDRLNLAVDLLDQMQAPAGNLTDRALATLRHHKPVAPVSVPGRSARLLDEALAHVTDATSGVMQRTALDRDPARQVLAAIPSVRRRLQPLTISSQAP